MRIHAGLGARWIKPCLLELGGKNAAIVMPSADLDAAAEGVMRSAFSLQNQKCSATAGSTSTGRRRPFLERLLERTRGIRIGDPSERDVFFGPVINERAVERYERAVAQARTEGDVLLGGDRLTGGGLERGHLRRADRCPLPLGSSLFREELFVPFLAVGEVESLDEALAEANAAEYGLTAGIFSARAGGGRAILRRDRGRRVLRQQAHRRHDGRVARRAGVLRLEGSGSTGKGGCGPYYVAQFMREQSRTVIE